MAGDVNAIPAVRLLELRYHLQYLLDAEASKPSPVFTAFFETSDDDSDDEAGAEDAENGAKGAAEDGTAEGADEAADSSSESSAEEAGEEGAEGAEDSLGAGSGPLLEGDDAGASKVPAEGSGASDGGVPGAADQPAAFPTFPHIVDPVEGNLKEARGSCDSAGAGTEPVACAAAGIAVESGTQHMASPIGVCGPERAVDTTEYRAAADMTNVADAAVESDTYRAAVAAAADGPERAAGAIFAGTAAAAAPAPFAADPFRSSASSSASAGDAACASAAHAACGWAAAHQEHAADGTAAAGSSGIAGMVTVTGPHMASAAVTAQLNPHELASAPWATASADVDIHGTAAAGAAAAPDVEACKEGGEGEASAAAEGNPKEAWEEGSGGHLDHASDIAGTTSAWVASIAASSGSDFGWRQMTTESQAPLGGDGGDAGGADAGGGAACDTGCAPASSGESCGGQAAGGSEADESRAAKRPRRAVLISPAWREGAVAAAELAMRRRLQAAKDGDKLELMLQQVHYSQESIRGFFRDGRPVSQMLRELRAGEKAVADIPKISAVLWNGTIYSADNRRLWTFKHCGMPHDTRIPVVVGAADGKFLKKLTSPSAGRTVRRRGDQGFT